VLKAGDTSALVVAKLNRLSRSMIYFSALMGTAQDGARWYAATDWHVLLRTAQPLGVLRLTSALLSTGTTAAGPRAGEIESRDAESDDADRDRSPLRGRSRSVPPISLRSTIAIWPG
jgi:hypothetical protein